VVLTTGRQGEQQRLPDRGHVCPVNFGGLHHKYAPVFPERFASLAHARQFMTDFVAWYNECHHHAGIGMHTPSEAHHRRHHAVQARRAESAEDSHQ
jgi:hypothetical protein